MNAQRMAHLVMVFCLIGVPAVARAQSAASGAIAGVVRDTTGAVLPGVTVEAASPALIEKVRIAATDEQGLYRIVDLRPGVYTVTFTLPGFATFRREGLELTTGFTATANAEMRVGALEETVTVTGASPLVDIQNVRTQTVLSRAVLDSVPTGKTIQGYATLLVGAALPASAQDVGGNQGEFPVAFAIHGNRANDLKLKQDGMSYNSMQGSGGGPNRNFLPNQASIQEVTLETGGVSAESETGGVQLNLVPKEGGNTFRSSFFSNYADHNLQGKNLTDDLRARGLTTEVSVKRVYDVGIGLGGPIKQDRLWFYTGHRWWGAQQYVGTYFNQSQQSWSYIPNFGRPAYSNIYNRDHNGRVTWQASPKNKFNVSLGYQHNCNCFFQVGIARAPEATTSLHYLPSYLAQATWSHPATNRLLLEAGASHVHTRVSLERMAGVSSDTIAVVELSNNYSYRARAVSLAHTYGRKINDQPNQRFAVSYITGSHAFKTGVTLGEGGVDSPEEINGDLSYTFNFGVPVSLTQWATPVFDRERIRMNLGLFAQDQWTIRKLTLNLGVRFDYFNGQVPEARLEAGQFVPRRDFPAVSDVPNWKNISPRLGGAYDLFGNGKTALKASLGRYVASQAILISSANAPVNRMVSSTTRTWNDANGNFVPDCDLRSVAANAECGAMSNARFGTVVNTTRYADDVLQGWGAREYNWQASASLQHELRPGLALNIGYFRAWYGNFTVTDNLAVTPADYDPFCITAPVDPRLPGGGGNQICGLYDINPAKFGQVNNLVTQSSHYGRQTEHFNGVDASMNWRFGQGGLIQGGLSTGRTVTNNCFVVDSPQQTRFCQVTLPFSAQTQVKFSGVYPLAWGLQASGAFQSLPGLPIDASYVATNAQIAPSLGRNLAAGARGTVVVDLIEPNTRREDRIHQLDVRLTKKIRVGRTQLEGMFDVYNVLNANSILTMTTRYGSAWLKPGQILAARLFKFGVQLDF